MSLELSDIIPDTLFKEFEEHLQQFDALNAMRHSIFKEENPDSFTDEHSVIGMSSVEFFPQNARTYKSVEGFLYRTEAGFRLGYLRKQEATGARYFNRSDFISTLCS